MEALPNELIREITNYIDPISIVKLSHVSGRFRRIFNNAFWEQYNSKNNYPSFSEEEESLFSISVKTAPAKMMIAKYYYNMWKNLYCERKQSAAEVLFSRL